MRLSPSLVALLALSLVACGKGEDKAAGSASAASSASMPASAAGSGAAAPKPAEPAKDQLTVTVKPLAVGMKATEKETSEIKLKMGIEIGGKNREVSIVEGETMQKTVEILETDGKAVTKARVSYAEKKKTLTEDGKEKKRPKSPIEGKSYVLEYKNSKLEITDEKGKKAPKNEDEEVRKNNSSFGKPDPVVAGMPATAIKVGDKVDSLASAFDAMFKARDESKNPMVLSGVEVKLTSIEKPGPEAIGLFEIAVTVESPKDTKEPVGMKAPLKGTMKVRAKDGRVLGITLGGQVTVSGSEPKLKISGSGDMKMVMEMSY